MSISVIRFTTRGKGIAHLVHHIDEGLCVVPKERRGRVALILSREEGPDQGGGFMSILPLRRSGALTACVRVDIFSGLV